MSENNGTVVVRADQLQRVLTLLAEGRFVLEKGRGAEPAWRVVDADDNNRVVGRPTDEKAAERYRAWLIAEAVAQLLASLQVEGS